MRRTEFAAAGLLALFVGLVWSAAARKCETYDEGFFIAGGVAQVHRLDPNIDLSHPPLLRWLAGLPATLLASAQPAPDPPFVPPGAVALRAERLERQFEWARTTFYLPANDHDRVLFWGRSLFALVGALTGWQVFVEVRRRYGDVPGLVALAMFCLTPEVLAHAEWAHSDLPSAFSILAVALALARVLERAQPRRDVLLGAALGLALLLKLTAVLLLPLVAGLVVALAPAPPGRVRAAHACLRVAIAAGVAYAVLVAGYAPHPRAFAGHDFLAADVAPLLHAPPDSSVARAAVAVLDRLPLPDSFLKGVVFMALLGRHGKMAFFHGLAGARSWWYYFPAAVALKYPTPLLLLAVAGLVVLVRDRAQSAGRRVALVATPLWMFALAMAQSVDIGVRSVLFVAPFLALWSGAAVAAARTRFPRVLAASLAALSIASGVAAWPDFLAYFNPLFGGTRAAGRWLADSNLDWGQDLPELARTLARRGIGEVRLAYFGAGMPRHWGIRSLSADVIAPGWYAISRTLLAGLAPPEHRYGWLAALPPVELVGGSIALVRATPADAEAALRTASAEQLMATALDARFRRHDLDAAIRLFRQLLAADPGHYGASYQLAAALDAAGDASAALAAWRAFLPSAERAGDAASAATASARIAALAGPPRAP
ncbi:MAG TPA: glycosyltransferase family 39 protein [Thermoanaerobaculaceae bacterium]|nr:glycosyltransferase family 39 protein [Thermoanaerobaculaceae bacterium]